MSTPTKAAEIREALNDLRNGLFPNIKAVDDRIDRALALLADMEMEGELVAWMSENGRALVRHTGENAPNGCTIPLYRHPSPTTADAPPDPDAHITDQEQYLKAKQERAKDVEFEECRTPVAYAMSRDYEALWEMLKVSDVLTKITIVKEDRWGMANATTLGCPRGYESCVREWSAISLEWIAPVDVAEVIKAGDAMAERIEALRTKFNAASPQLQQTPESRRLRGAVSAVCVHSEQWTNATKPFRP